MDYRITPAVENAVTGIRSEMQQLGQAIHSKSPSLKLSKNS